MVSVLVVENDVLLLEAAANANVEMLVPPAVLMTFLPPSRAQVC